MYFKYVLLSRFPFIPLCSGLIYYQKSQSSTAHRDFLPSFNIKNGCLFGRGV